MEGVAFLTLFDYQKRILLHSNLELIGKKIEFSPFLQRGENISFLTLNTGERVFLYENKVKLKDSDGILRIALHIHPVSDSLYFARIHFYTEVIFAFLFFVFGLFSFLILDRLNRTKEKIEELEKWQRITQILIHEIKNPLASIKGFTQYLQRKITDHTQLKAAEIIYRESLRLERLIGSLSQFSYPFESKFTEVELISLIREVLASIQFLYPESIVHFDTQITEAKIRSDRDKFKSILIN
ncbi:MAG: histidine kinase dimerization/phospho-acceptor domain-containing protein, partial [Candidatus Kryptonium sp.]